MNTMFCLQKIQYCVPELRTLCTTQVLQYTKLHMALHNNTESITQNYLPSYTKLQIILYKYTYTLCYSLS